MISTTYSDPYHQIGLHRNPFVSEDMMELMQISWIDRGLSSAPPVRAKLFVQIRGAEGSGKTSHLLHWQQQTNGVYASYPPDRMRQVSRRWRVPPIGEIAYWDEAQVIPNPLLLLALAQAAIYKSTIVAATHTDLSWAAQWVGLTVKTIQIPTLDKETLLNWAHLRIMAAKLPNASEVSLHLTPEVIAEILAKSGNSWRTAATLLHIWAATNARDRVTVGKL